MLWIAMVLPQLPLQVSHRSLLPDLPLAVSDGAVQRPLVVAANGPACDAGIAPGIPVAAAQALVPQLLVQPYDPSRAQAAIESLALWAGQFTPSVVLEEDGVVLEIQASLKLFGGLPALGRQLEQGATRLGFTVSISVAPTPLGALLFARARILHAEIRGCLTIRQLPSCLALLPLSVFGWPSTVMETLEQLGVSTIGACRALPREGIVRRFGAAIVQDLDRADGSVADPRNWFAPPLRFASRIDLPFALDQTDWLATPIRHLLAELEGYLLARHQGTQEIRLTLDHDRKLRNILEIVTSSPCCLAEDFALLVQERLARTVLHAPVQAVALEVDRLVPYVAENLALPGNMAGNGPVNDKRHALAWSQLCDRLVARLPPGQLHRLAIGDDHRPEKAWRFRTGVQDGCGKTYGSTPDALETVPMPPRPAWLLRQPQALQALEGMPTFHGVLRLLTEPERIEAGWWDDDPVSRDYYIARNPAGQLCWVFHDHADKRWYLHGLFG